MSTWARCIRRLSTVPAFKTTSSDIKEQLKVGIYALRQQNPDFSPGLAIVQVGNREDSNVYIRMKLKAAKDVGITARHIRLPPSTTQHELVSRIKQLNEDPSVHGMIVQLPLDTEREVDSELCLNTIKPSKDVDGLHAENAAKLCRGDLHSCIIPCTPRGCLELIHRTGTEIKGKRAVVVGRSRIVGMPMANLLLWHHATVTICHSRTQDLDKVVGEADILVAAVGVPEMIKGAWIKPGAVVIDCGINPIPDESKKSGKRLVGDVEFHAASERASWITPVPGGVGPMTVAMLLRNTLDSAKKSLQDSG